jgi:hypothetical protein
MVFDPSKVVGDTKTPVPAISFYKGIIDLFFD